MSLVAGTRLGPYEIQAAIGAGGMGEVYKARDTRLDRSVAIKVLPPDFSADPASTGSGPSRAKSRDDRRARFEREAKIVAGLNHPHIVTVHDVSEDHDVVFIVMEYVDGRSLSEAIGGKGLGLPEAIRIAIQVVSALEAGIDLRIRDFRDDGETKIPLSGRFQGNFGLRLNADGSLATFRDWDGQRFVTYLAPTDGSGRTVLCDDCSVLHFASEPRVVFLWAHDTVVQRDLDGSTDRRLLDIPVERFSDAAVSADARWLAVLLENADRTADIAVASLSRLPVTERDLTVVAHDDRHLASPRWSADGTLLYYLSQRDGFVCIWAQRLDPRTRTAVGPPFPVLHQHESRLSRFGPKNIFSFEVAADVLLFNLMETRGNIWTASLTDRTGGEQ